MTNYQRTYSIGEVEVERAGAAIFHTTEHRERRDHVTLFGCTREVAGFDTSRDAFVGVHNGLHEAAVPFAGNATGSIAHGWNPIGAHQINVHLEPGSAETFSFVLAYVEEGGTQVGLDVLDRYSDPAAVDEGVRASPRLLGRPALRFQVECPDPHVERMLNTWNQYQCIATFNLSRSASLFETGIGRGMGFRDSNQDILGFVHLIPDQARQRILDLASTQLSDGTCFHQYQPLTREGNAEIGGGFNDDPLWLVLSTCAYIKETGDTSILSKRSATRTRPAAAKTSCTTWRRASPTRSRIEARTACR